MGHVGKALILFQGPRHGEHLLRAELRRGLRPWGDFYTCPDFIGSSYKLPQPCKVAFVDRVEVMGANPPEEMHLVDDRDRKQWRRCEDVRTSFQRRHLRTEFAVCHAIFESWLWGYDADDQPGADVGFGFPNDLVALGLNAEAEAAQVAIAEENVQTMKDALDARVIRVIRKSNEDNLYLHLNHEEALAAKGMPDDGSTRSEDFLCERRYARHNQTVARKLRVFREGQGAGAGEGEGEGG